MQINHITPAPKKLFFLLFILCVTALNFNLSVLVRSHINVSQVAMGLFIAIGFFISKKMSLTSIICYGIFVLFAFVASIIGFHNVWLYNDLGKLLLLATMMFIYIAVFDTKEEFTFFIKVSAWLFILTVLIYLPFNLYNIFMNNRLIISCFGKGGEDLGWAAAALYILVLSVIPKGPSYFKSGYNTLCITLMTILLLSLARSAILSVLVYGIFSRKWRFLLDGIFGTLISIIFITLALETKIVAPNGFLVQNLYRYLPRSISAKVYRYLISSASAASIVTPAVSKAMVNTTHSSAMGSVAAATATKVAAMTASIPVPYAQNWILTGRSLIWASFISYFLHADLLHKLLGFGIGSVTLDVKLAGFLSRDPHNLYIDILFNFGLIGLALFFYAIIKSFTVFIKKHLTESISILAMIVASGLFNTLWRYSGAIWITALIAATPYIYKKLSREGK